MCVKIQFTKTRIIRNSLDTESDPDTETSVMSDSMILLVFYSQRAGKIAFFFTFTLIIFDCILVLMGIDENCHNPHI